MHSIRINDYELKTEKEILKEIKERLFIYKDSPIRQYLLECAHWAPSENRKGLWIAYSPIYDSDIRGFWPIYSIDVKYTEKNEKDEIAFFSRNEDHDEMKRCQPQGNLSFKGKRNKFKGKIWTCRE